MSDISKIQLPDASEYDIKDTVARAKGSIYYGTCATASGTKDKVATVSSNQNFVLQVGSMVAVKFSNTNSYSATASNHITLNVNSTGAFDIWYSNTNATTGTQTAAFGIANNYHYYMYDGTYWIFAGRSLDGDSGNVNLRLNAAIKAGTDAIVSANIICANSSNLYYHLKKGTAFDIRWPILYANADIAANGTGTNNYVMVNVAIATTQSLTLTAYKPLYIKGTLSGTTFTPISTAPITQTVPTAEDGYYYLYLGVAISTTNFYLLDYHPIYVYVSGSFKIYDQSFAVNKNLQGVDLNTVKETGFYYAGGNNGCSNMPSNYTQATGFGLIVEKTAKGNYLIQIYCATSNNMFSRVCSNGTWSVWVRFNDRVYQSVTTSANWRKVVLSAQNDVNPETAVAETSEQVHLTPKVEVQASTGTLRSEVLTSKTNVNIGNGAASMQYNSNTQSIDFVFPS